METEILTPQQLKEALLPYWKAWAPDCEFVLDETTENKTAGSYNVKKKIILIRYLSLLKDFERLKKTEMHSSLFELTLLIVAHEIGHHLDPELILLRRQGQTELLKAKYIKHKLEKKERNRERYLRCVENYCKIIFYKEVHAWKIAKRLTKDELSKDFFTECQETVYCLI